MAQVFTEKAAVEPLGTVQFELEGPPDPANRDFDNSLRCAIDARDECVAFFGVDSSVLTTTSSTCSAVIEPGRPGLGSSSSRTKRSSTNRERHLLAPPIGGDTPTRAVTSLLLSPSAHPCTIRDRRANAWD